MDTSEITWDLSPLVENTEPARISDRLGEMIVEAQRLRDRFHGRIEDCDPNSILALLEARDAYKLKFEGLVKYCRLMYSADSTDNVAKQLNDAARKGSTKVEQTLAFIDIELGRLVAKKPSLVTEPELKDYRHYLERILRRAPHMLPENEERLVLMKDRNGIEAWEMLQSDWLSTRTFDIEVEGEMENLPYGKIVGFYESSNRDLRKRANQVVYEGLGKDDIIWASAMRAVCEDHLEMCKARKHPSPISPSLIDNDVDQETIDSLMNTIMKNVGLYQRYLKLKARLMGLDRLANYDVAAPLPNAPEKEYDWREARKEAVDAYTSFDEQMGRWVEEMFEERRIDGEVRKGKTSGAWCSSWMAGKSAYILQSFNNRLGDVFTQVHELGHAVHSYLGSRAQNPSNLEIGSCVAETGSIFGELLLAEQLLQKAKTKEDKQVILAHVLDEFGVAAFQVSARMFFEQSMYDAIERGEFLDGETVAKLWVTARNQIYGDSVSWLDIMKWEWTMKVHYYLANYRFYNYPYVFAQLFVFALYRVYKKEGQSFIPKLKSLLSAGSSKSPRELAYELGFDITKTAFWEKGMAQAEEFIDALEETTR